MKRIIPAFILCFILTGCFGLPESREPKVTLIDQELVPQQLVEVNPSIQIEGKFVNIDSGEIIVKTVNIKDYQGWYLISPKTFKKLIAAGTTPKGRVVVMSEESDPFSITENNKNIEIEVRMVSVESQKEVLQKVKLADYIKWVVIHPHMYKRLAQTALK